MNIIQDYYNRINFNYGMTSSRRKKILSLIGNVTNKKIIDIGCANGYFGRLLQESGNEVFGFDISEQAIAESKKVLSSAEVLDIQKDILPFESGSIDIAIFSETIEHLFLPEKALQEIKRVLKDNGYVLITTPNFLVLSNRIKMLLGNFTYTESGFLDRGHIHFFTYKSLVKILDDCGFIVMGQNHVPYFRVPDFFAQYMPNLFAFQIIVKAGKK